MLTNISSLFSHLRCLWIVLGFSKVINVPFYDDEFTPINDDMLCALLFVIPCVSFPLCHSMYFFYSLMFTIVATSITHLFSFNISFQIILLLTLLQVPLHFFFFEHLLHFVIHSYCKFHCACVSFQTSFPFCCFNTFLQAMVPFGGVDALLQHVHHWASSSSYLLDYKVFFTFLPLLFILQGFCFMPIPKYHLSFWVQTYDFFLETITSFM